ncbi:MAG: NAD(P)-dependent oxidoreductase [Oscillospiraceae bacterium]|nr:NAD(P)-dependent oxidoreductase [Oscillospiraceae bacterium]
MRAVVITGADGFIGSHLVQHLAKQGILVYAIVLNESKTRFRVEGLQNVNVVAAAPEDYMSLCSILPMEPDAFIHLAWDGVAPEKRNSTEKQSKNISCAFSAVRLAATIRAGRFILPGSTAEYMNSGTVINEKTLPSPQNAYGSAKIAVRYLCRSLCDELGIPFVYAVITGIYASDRTDNNVIYYAISNLLAGKKPSFTKLEQLWDYVHIDDVVRAFACIAEKGKDGAFYAIGHGDNWPLRNYIYQIRDIINPSLPLGIGEIPYTGGSLPISCVDLTALRRDTGFEPVVSFEAGIRDVIAKVAEQMNNKENL